MDIILKTQDNIESVTYSEGKTDNVIKENREKRFYYNICD